RGLDRILGVRILEQCVVTCDPGDHFSSAPHDVDRGAAPDRGGHLSRLDLAQVERCGYALGPRALRRAPGLDERNGGEHSPNRAGRDRRPGEEFAPAQVDFILSDDCVLRHQPLSRLTPRSLAVHRAPARTRSACGAISYLAGGGALYTNEHPLRPHESGALFAGFPGARAMLKRAASAVIFVAGSVIGGLALAFLIVALRPDLIRATPRPPEPATPAAERALPAP